MGISFKCDGMTRDLSKAPSIIETEMEGYIKMKQNNLAFRDKQAFTLAVVKISQKYGLGISQKTAEVVSSCLPTVMTGLPTKNHRIIE